MSEQESQIRPPLRVQPLEYSVPTYRRPGLVTAIGVIDIVVAAATLLMSLFLLLMSIGAAAQSGTPAAVPAATRTPPTVVTEEGTSGMRGLAPGVRSVVIATLRDVRSFSDIRAQHFDALLADAGQDVFPFDASQITPRKVRGNLTDDGKLISGNDSEGPEYFVLGNGRIELSDAQAVFFPSDGRPAVRASAGGISNDPSAVATTAAPAAIPPPPPVLRPRTNAAVAVLALLEALASLGLAVFLLIIGVLVFRSSPGGARQHRFYAIAKLALATFATFIWMWLWVDFAGGSAGRGGSIVLAIFGAAIGLSGAIYPIALLLALRSREVREYYDGIRASIGAPT
jgi:hypothetical protein